MDTHGHVWFTDGRTKELFGYRDEAKGDPQAVRIVVTMNTHQIIEAYRNEESVFPWETGGFMRVTDIEGKEWDIASAPCGNVCHCATVIREV